MLLEYQSVLVTQTKNMDVSIARSENEFVVMILPCISSALKLAERCIKALPELAVSMHHGELIVYHNPLTTCDTYIGIELSQVVDLCHSTQPGQILATTTFVHALQHGGECAYLDFQRIGSIPLTKIPVDIYSYHLNSPKKITRSSIFRHSYKNTLTKHSPQLVLDFLTTAIHDFSHNSDFSAISRVAEQIPAILSTIEDEQENDAKRVSQILISLAKFLAPWWRKPQCVQACEFILSTQSSVLDSSTKYHLEALHCLQIRFTKDVPTAQSACTALLNKLSADPSNELADLQTEMHLRLSTFARLDGDMESALKHAKQAQHLAEMQNTDTYLSQSYQRLAMISLEMSTNLERGITYLERALRVAQRSKDPQLRLKLLMDLGAQESMRDLKKSRAFLGEALALSHHLHVPLYSAAILQAFADVSIQLDNLAEAADLLEQARTITLEENDDYILHNVLYEQAVLALLSCRPRDSLRKLDQASHYYKNTGTDYYTLDCTCLEVCAYAAMGNDGAMLDAKQRLSEQANLLDHQPWQVILSNLVCGISSAQDTDIQTLEATRDYIEQAQQVGDRYKLVRFLCEFSFFRFPKQMQELMTKPTLLVATDCSWFQSPGHALARVNHRPYIHRLFSGLIHNHQHQGSQIDTQTLFKIGWPGESITPKSMANRVYVGIAHLRQLGLANWLTSSRQGYSLSQHMNIIKLACVPNGLP